MDIPRLVADKLSVIPQLRARCLGVLRISEIGIIGVGHPILHAAVEWTLIVNGNVHVAVAGCHLNAQRRCRRFLLFHGSLLLNCDLDLIAELLPMPSLEPDYRAHRPHGDFVTNLNVPAEKVKAALAQAWNVDGIAEPPPGEALKKLARGKYATREWNLKF